MDNKKNYIKNVSIIRDKDAFYPEHPPFHPSEAYPEYIFGERYVGRKNPAYRMVRDTLKALMLDIDNFGGPGWSPFSPFVKRGDSVVIKPNFVQDYHDGGDDIFSVITHGSIIRAIVDYVAIALKNSGTIYIADAPMMNSNFEKISELTGIKKILELYNKETDIKIHVVDLRVMRVDLGNGFITRRFKLDGDPNGYLAVNLSSESMFSQIDKLTNKLRGSDYDVEETLKHHNALKNEYLISKTVLDADFFINLPKLKTHKKAGVTLSLKNLIGINGDKNWIPHYRIGGPNTFGDEFETSSSIRHLESILKENFKRFVLKHKNFNPISKRIRKLQKYLVDNYNVTPIRGGAWFGNDTIWRSIIDLNIILLYLDKKGRISNSVQRNYFSLIDGIIGGERNGPMNPRPKYSNTIIAGFSPLTVDICAVKLMGLDWKKIPLMRNIIGLKGYFNGIDVDDIRIFSNDPGYTHLLDDTTSRNETLCFIPADGWVGKIELDESDKTVGQAI